MALVRITDLAKFGVIADRDEIAIPPNAWTMSRNVRFRDGKITVGAGNAVVYDPVLATPYWLLFVFRADRVPIWIYAGLKKVSTIVNLAHSDITRTSGDYAADIDHLWNGGILAGIPILNNGVDIPQYWPNPSLAGNLVDLANWPAGFRAKVIRPYKNFLVAMNMREAGVDYPHRFRWSHPAQPGGIPISWDDADPTKDAGIAELTDIEDGHIMDGLPMGDTFIIYKERSIHGMRFKGGQYKMEVYKIFNNVGALAKNCMCAFGENFKHFVLTGEDIIQHDGQTVASVLDERDRRWLAANLDTANFQHSFVVPYTDQKECWACIPIQGSLWPNIAIIWNYVNGTITFRDIDRASFIWPGILFGSSSFEGDWNSDPDPWDIDTSSWMASTTKGYARTLLQACPEGAKLIALDVGVTDEDRGDLICTLERTGLSVVSVDSNGTPISDTDIRKLVKGITIQGLRGPITITVGRTQEVGSEYAWGTPRVFTPGQDHSLEFLDDPGPLDCRTYALRFQWNGKAPGTLDSYAIDVEPLGVF